MLRTIFMEYYHYLHLMSVVPTALGGRYGACFPDAEHVHILDKDEWLFVGDYSTSSTNPLRYSPSGW